MKKSEKLYKAVGLISDDTITEVEEHLENNRQFKPLRWQFTSLAAAALVLVAGTLLMFHALGPPREPALSGNPEVRTTAQITSYICALPELEIVQINLEQPDGFDEDGNPYFDIILTEFPEVDFFRWSGGYITMNRPQDINDKDPDNIHYEGSPMIWFGGNIIDLFIVDLNGDGFPEFVATVQSWGDVSDTFVAAIDIADYIKSGYEDFWNQLHFLRDRTFYDYRLHLENDKLIVTQTEHSMRINLISSSLHFRQGELAFIDNELTAIGVERAFDVFATMKVDIEEFNGASATMMERIYECDRFVYELSSLRSGGIMLTFEDGTRMSLREALDNKLIGIDDLMLNGLRVSIQPKYDDSSVTIEDEVRAFSYESDLDMYGEYWSAGGFWGQNLVYKNTEPNPILTKEDAIGLAMNEVDSNFSYNLIWISYDDVLEMWKVVFATENMFGGCQSVYLNSDGITELIVFGE
jgi:hypothetical protein